MSQWNRLKKYLPTTICAFPVGDSKNESEKKSKKGVALIIAVMAVSMIMIFSSNMIVTSTVNLELAVANRDNIKAEYMAKSSLNLGVYALIADHAFDLAMYQISKKQPIDSYSDVMISTLSKVPLSGENAEMIGKFAESFGFSQLTDDKILDTLKLFDGTSSMRIEDEQAKINLGKCSYNTCRDTMAMLELLMSCPAEKSFLDKKTLVPRQMANRIKDWMDPNTTPEDTGFSSEDDPYEKKVPPYKSKNVPMESVNELRLIEGWDDDMHAVFSPYITIYPYIQQLGDAKLININTAEKELLACLFPTAKVDCRDKFHKKIIETTGDDATAVAEDRKAVEKILSEDMCYVKDEADKASWFTTKSSIFRIRATGTVGQQTKEIEMVIERVMPDKAKTEKTKKSDSSYNILYYRMI